MYLKDMFKREATSICERETAITTITNKKTNQ